MHGNEPHNEIQQRRGQALATERTQRLRRILLRLVGFLRLMAGATWQGTLAKLRAQSSAATRDWNVKNGRLAAEKDAVVREHVLLKAGLGSFRASQALRLKELSVRRLPALRNSTNLAFQDLCTVVARVYTRGECVISAWHVVSLASSKLSVCCFAWSEDSDAPHKSPLLIQSAMCVRIQAAGNP